MGPIKATKGLSYSAVSIPGVKAYTGNRPGMGNKVKNVLPSHEFIPRKYSRAYEKPSSPATVQGKYNDSIASKRAGLGYLGILLGSLISTIRDNY